MVLHTLTRRVWAGKIPMFLFSYIEMYTCGLNKKHTFLKTNDLFKHLSWNWPFFFLRSLQSQKQELPYPPRTLLVRVKFTNSPLLPCKASFLFFWPFPLLTDPTDLPALFSPESLQSSPSHPEATLQKAEGGGIT